MHDLMSLHDNSASYSTEKIFIKKDTYTSKNCKQLGTDIPTMKTWLGKLFYKNTVENDAILIIIKYYLLVWKNIHDYCRMKEYVQYGSFYDIYDAYN